MDPDLLIATIRDPVGARGGERLPSLFELLLVDQIDGMLRPALRHGLVSLCDSAPSAIAASPLLATCHARSEELCRLALLAAQWVCVRSYGASISEVAYGLTRRGVLGDGSVASSTAEKGATAGLARPHVAATQPLRQWQRDASVFFVAVMPLLLEALRSLSRQLRARVLRRQRRRLELQREHERELERGQEGEARQSLAQGGGFHRLLQGVSRAAAACDRGLQVAAELSAEAFPYLQGAAGLAVVVQRFRYLCGDSVFSHPLLALVSVALVRRDTSLHSAAAPGLGLAEGASVGASERQVALAPTTTGPPAASGANGWRTAAVVAALAGAKGLQWYLRNREAHAALSQRTRLAAVAASSAAAGGHDGGVRAVPPPPQPVAHTAVPADRCPLCRKPHRSPCVSTGGYVFCQACLLQRLRADAAAGVPPVCPVSGVPCAEEAVIYVH